MRTPGALSATRFPHPLGIPGRTGADQSAVPGVRHASVQTERLSLRHQGGPICWLRTFTPRRGSTVMALSTPASGGRLSLWCLATLYAWPRRWHGTGRSSTGELGNWFTSTLSVPYNNQSGVSLASLASRELANFHHQAQDRITSLLFPARLGGEDSCPQRPIHRRRSPPCGASEVKSI